MTGPHVAYTTSRTADGPTGARRPEQPPPGEALSRTPRSGDTRVKPSWVTPEEHRSRVCPSVTEPKGDTPTDLTELTTMISTSIRPGARAARTGALAVP